MPLYGFVNEETEEYREIFFHMNDDKIYNGLDGSEIGKWRRVFFVPQASIDTRVDPHSAKDFVKATNKKGTIGSLFDQAAELSEKRGGPDGDPIRQKHYEDWSKKRNGKKHPDIIAKERKERLKKVEKKYGITIKDK